MKALIDNQITKIYLVKAVFIKILLTKLYLKSYFKRKLRPTLVILSRMLLNFLI